MKINQILRRTISDWFIHSKSTLRKYSITNCYDTHMQTSDLYRRSTSSRDVRGLIVSRKTHLHLIEIIFVCINGGWDLVLQMPLEKPAFWLFIGCCRFFEVSSRNYWRFKRTILSMRPLYRIPLLAISAFILSKCPRRVVLNENLVFFFV